MFSIKKLKKEEVSGIANVVRKLLKERDITHLEAVLLMSNLCSMLISKMYEASLLQEMVDNSREGLESDYLKHALVFSGELHKEISDYFRGGHNET